MGYPGIELDINGDEIKGFIFESRFLSDHWTTLDNFEGAEYQRVLAEVKLSDETRVNAYIYVLNNQ